MAFFFLGSIALPDARDLTNVEGRITQVGIKYRKGIGSYYTLDIKTATDNIDQVLVGQSVAANDVAQSLVGRTVVARVSTSSEAVELAIPGVAAFNFDISHSPAAARKLSYDIIGWFGLICGLILGGYTLTRRTE